MKALEIIESYTTELTEKNIVICSYLLQQDPSIVVDCIDISYEEEYPQFNIVDVIVEDIYSREIYSGDTEGYVGS
jgi:hypothetical protein